MELRRADVVLTKGSSILSVLIRFFTRSIGEKRTKVNHAGIVVKDGPVETAFVVEALSRVKRHRLWGRYGPPARHSVAVYRARNISGDETEKIVGAAESFVGRKYSYLRLVAHLLDWMLLGAYFFRKIVRMDKYPICSWLVAHAFGKAGKDFGVDSGAANPDDIWDFIEDHPEIYLEIHPLKPLQVTGDK